MKSCIKSLICSCAIMPLIAGAFPPKLPILDGGPGPGPRLPPQHKPDRTVRPVRPSAPAVQTLDTAKIVCRIRELSQNVGKQLYELWNQEEHRDFQVILEDLDKLRCYLGSLYYFTDFKNTDRDTDESVLNEYVLWSGLRHKKIADFKKKVSKESHWRKLDEIHKEIILKAKSVGISFADILNDCIYNMFLLDAGKKQDAEIMETYKRYIARAIGKLSDSTSREQLKEAYGLE